MAAENWQQVRDIFDVALRQKPEERTSFVNEVCGGDKTLLTEVESLLTSLDSAESFMETPAIAKVAEQVLTEQRQFSNGQYLNHYKIVRPIGTGGMGEVYLATDTKLNRQVALKVLHPNLFSDNQANRRLVREAQAAAILDHPHICAIHEISETDEGSFIVMHYVEGETLADVLAERLTVEKSLDLAIQIADALSEAHAHSIIHRDIKPANIIVNEKGQAKVLDFGLAKFIEAESQEDTVKRLNSSGAVMGTVPYMSPEQLRGKRLDARTDIFSFGAMFYEMLSGQQAFAKESNAETISAILNDEPDWTRIPARLQPIVQKSLKKKRDERYQTAQDLTRDLRETQKSGELLIETDRESSERNKAEAISTSPFKRFFSRETAGSKIPLYRFWKSSGPSVEFGPETTSLGNGQTIRSKNRLGYPAIFAAVTIFLLIGAAGWLVWQLKTNPDSNSFDDLRSVRLVSWKTAASSVYSDYRVSRDGKMVAYSSSQDGPPEGIFVKQTNDGAEIRVTKDEWRNVTPIWSPNDQRIAFASMRENQWGIYSIPAFGGVATPLKIIGPNDSFGLKHWSKDGTAIFYELEGNFYRLNIATQEIIQLTNFAPSNSQTRFFSLSPNEDKIVYVDKTNGQTDLWMSALRDGSPIRLTNDKDIELQTCWHPDGERVLYTVYRNNYYQINVAYTDLQKPRQVTRGESEFRLIDVSGDGTKIYYLSRENKSDIWGVKAETGEEFEIASGIETEYWTDVSPDGQSIAYQSNLTEQTAVLSGDSSIIIKSLTNQFPPLSVKGYNPRWLPDSRRVAFLRRDETQQKLNLWLVNTINGEEKQIVNSGINNFGYSLLPYNRNQNGEYRWTADSSKVGYVAKESGFWNVLITAPESGETVNLTNNTNPNLYYYCPFFSLDGKLIAFMLRQIPTSKDEKMIWKIWIVGQDGIKEIYSTTASLRLLGWTADGEFILEKSDVPMRASPLDITLLSLSATGQKRFETVFKNIYVTSMSLSADGKMVVFTARRDDKDNIFVASTTNGEARKITTNGNSKLFYGSPAISPDDKKIFFDKQEETNIISRLENFN
ncbi:MAG: protein kinase [Pyrinomonadaceae bacterium]